MPPKVLPTQGSIHEMSEVLRPRGFYPVQGLEHFRIRTKDERAVAPHPRKGAELGFAVDKDDLTVVVWTSWLPHLQCAREKDCGWIIIEQAGKRKYCLSLHRTKNFAKHMIIEAKIARCRIRTRPTCKVCGVGMGIARGKAMGSRYWRCPAYHARESWDHEEFLKVLSSNPQAMRYLACRRRQREAWYEKCRKAGKPIRQAVFRRKGWKRFPLPIAGL
jgi:hypothetical protein